MVSNLCVPPFGRTFGNSNWSRYGDLRIWLVWEGEQMIGVATLNGVLHRPTHQLYAHTKTLQQWKRPWEAMPSNVKSLQMVAPMYTARTIPKERLVTRRNDCYARTYCVRVGGRVTLMGQCSVF